MATHVEVTYADGRIELVEGDSYDMEDGWLTVTTKDEWPAPARVVRSIKLHYVEAVTVTVRERPSS